MVALGRRLSRGTSLLALTGMAAPILYCANADSATNRPYLRSASATAAWRIVPRIHVDCRTRRASEPSETTLNSIAASAPDDVWAVGECASGGRDLHRLGVVEHWDGTTWRRVSTPPTASYSAVAPLSKTDVWVGGNPVIHWDGRRWRAMSRGLPTGAKVVDLSATDRANVWAMFEIGDDSHMALARWDESRWNVVRFPRGCSSPGDDDDPELATRSGGEVWVDGLYCSGDPPGGTWRYDGRWARAHPLGPTWTEYPTVTDGRGGLWLFGGNPPRNRVQHWDGHRWSEGPLAVLPTGEHVEIGHATRVPGTSTVWAVGYVSEVCCEAVIETNAPR